MILPTKHLRADRSLIGVGSKILQLLSEPKTISRLWEDFNRQCCYKTFAPVTYEWFILGIDLLFLLGAVSYKKGQLIKTCRPHK